MAKTSSARPLTADAAHRTHASVGASAPLARSARRPDPAQLDRIVHERTRLAIVSALAVNQTLSFTDLKSVTGATDGNLSVHARRLETAGYVRCVKRFAGRTPRTEYTLTSTGRRALERYLDHMQALIEATRNRG